MTVAEPLLEVGAPPPMGIAIGRIGPPGAETTIVTRDGTAFDGSSVCPVLDWRAIESGALTSLAEAVQAGSLPPVSLTGQRLGAPIAEPRKVVCIGLNYHLHAQETGAAIPAEPVVFMKDPACVIGPNDPVRIPRGSTKTDWEVELAVVIGRTARYLESTEAALDCIAGYTISNDVSEREFQLERGGQWDKGKSCETFNPLGPWLVPASEIPDPQALGMRLWVDGELRQDSTTADMIFDVAAILRYLSQFMVLRPGDLVNTGTPAGVALGLPDTPYLRSGQRMTLQIERLGTQSQSAR